MAANLYIYRKSELCIFYLLYAVCIGIMSCHYNSKIDNSSLNAVGHCYIFKFWPFMLRSVQQGIADFVGQFFCIVRSEDRELQNIWT